MTHFFKKTMLLSFVSLSACTGSKNWQFDAISTGNSTFDSARLVYADSKLSPLRLEFVRLESGIEAFLSLARHRLSISSKHPESIEAEFIIDQEKYVESLRLLEGRMRLRLSTELTEKLIQALQDGKEIGILIDGFEQKITPVYFSEFFEKLSGAPNPLGNLFKGPFE